MIHSFNIQIKFPGKKNRVYTYRLGLFFLFVSRHIGRPTFNLVNVFSYQIQLRFVDNVTIQGP